MFYLSLQIIAVFFAVTSCSAPRIAGQQDVLIVDCIRKKTNFDMAKEGLVRIGLGEAYKPDEGRIAESYQTRKIKFTSLEEAKAFFNKIFTKYLKPINEDKRLASLAKGYPFSASNTELEITFIDTRGTPLASPNIARVRNSGSSVILYTYDQETRRYLPIMEEKAKG